MAQTAFEHLQAEIAALGSARSLGRVVQTGAGTLEVIGLSARAALGDRVRLLLPDGRRIGGEVLALRAGVDMAARWRACEDRSPGKPKPRLYPARKVSPSTC